jgi:AbiV family abortive infection protein
MAIDPQNVGLEAIGIAVENGELVFSEESKGIDFDRACDHVVVLLLDAVSCFEHGSYGTAVFLALTAIEEIAKAEVGLYRRGKSIKPTKRGSDKLFNHTAKHQMAILPTVFMGKRLEEAIGEERCKDLLEEAANGEFRSLREESLYFRNSNGQFVTPRDSISRARAREILLLAIEAGDDRLVGYTGHTGLIEQQLNDLFGAVQNS